MPVCDLIDVRIIKMNITCGELHWSIHMPNILLRSLDLETNLSDW